MTNKGQTHCGNTQTSGTFTCDFGFTGHWYHAPTALHLAPYRRYSAELGRWLNRDPIGEGGGVNLYAYALGKVVQVADVFGLEVTEVGGIFITTSGGSSPWGGGPNRCNQMLPSFGPRGDAIVRSALIGATANAVAGGVIGSIGGPVGTGIGFGAGAARGAIQGGIAGAIAGAFIPVDSNRCP